MHSILSSLSLLLLVSLVSCSAPRQKVALKITSAATIAGGGQTLAGVSQAGLMVWGMSSDGRHAFAKSLSANEEVLDLELPNGTWNFYAMAWQDTDTSGTQLSGEARCAHSVVQLSGVAVSPELKLARGNCSSGVFQTEQGTNVNSQLKFSFCEKIAGITESSHICSNDRSNLNHKSDSVGVMAMMVRIPEYTQGLVGPFRASSGGLASACIPNINNTGFSNLPHGLANAPHPFRVEIDLYFKDSECRSNEETPLNVKFMRGFAGDSLRSKYLRTNTTAGSTPSSMGSVYIGIADHEICTTQRKNFEDSAGGNGAYNTPKLICSESQFEHFLTITFADYSKNYRLAADLDLSDITNLSLGTFKGSLDGNHHVITNLVLVDKKGFIEDWSPELSSSSSRPKFIRDIVIVNPKISSAIEYPVGVLIGDAYSSDLSHSISGIKIIGGQVIGNVAVGGVVGKLKNINMSEIITQGIKVKGATNVGGILGAVEVEAFSNMKNILSQGEVIATNFENPFVGGVVGANNGTISGSEWTFDGVVKSNENSHVGLFYPGINSNSVSNLYPYGIIKTSSTKTPEFSNLFSSFHPCSNPELQKSIGDQRRDGRGSENNPIAICTQNQFNEISSLVSLRTLNLRLYRSFNLANDLSIPNNVTINGNQTHFIFISANVNTVVTETLTSLLPDIFQGY